MKKRNVIIVGLLSLSLLTGCRANILEHSQQDIKEEKVEKAKKETAKENKIERSQQDIKQEKVEKAKKEIENENKRGKGSSTKIITPNTSESTQNRKHTNRKYSNGIHTIRTPHKKPIHR